ncbi:MAG: pilus assembly protein PilP [Pseudomonadota bacterium]
MMTAKHRPSRGTPRALVLALSIAVLSGLGGCTSDMSDLEQWVAKTKSRPGGRIDELPTVEPYASYTYESAGERSPFVRTRRQEAVPQGNGLTPNRNRAREFLEGFPLDSLRMVGSLTNNGQNYALVQASDGLIHRVQPGNYIGQNDGQITAITESEIILNEIVPDGLGGYIERRGALALND